MENNATTLDESQDRYAISYFRALFLYGMLGYGTFLGVVGGLATFYLVESKGDLKGWIFSYVLVCWFVGLLVGWANRKIWGIYKIKENSN